MKIKSIVYIEEELKKEVQKLCIDKGISLSEAVSMGLQQIKQKLIEGEN